MMKKRLLSIMLCLALLLCMLPATAQASVGGVVWVNGYALHKGDYLPNNSLETVQERPQSGGYAYFEPGYDDVLTLHNYDSTARSGMTSTYTYDDVQYFPTIQSHDSLTINLEGTNNLKNTVGENPNLLSEGIAVRGGNLSFTGSGTLRIDADFGISAYNSTDVDFPIDENHGHVYFDRGSVKINCLFDGIFAQGGIEANHTDLTVNAGAIGMQAPYIILSGSDIAVRSTESLALLTVGGTITLDDETVRTPAGGTVTTEYSEGTPVCSIVDADGVPAQSVKLKGSFLDVPMIQYYTTPVLWAVEQGITTGTGGNKFSPDATCTRSQVVTFLWRAAGMPTPTQTECTFADVTPADYFYYPVLWAVEQGITTGTGGDKFSPLAPCNRDQVVTFLWRAEGRPAPTQTECSFSDVDTAAFYYDAMLWAIENGITTGTGGSKFSPTMPCSRGQIVTFLWRAAYDPIRFTLQPTADQAYTDTPLQLEVAVEGGTAPYTYQWYYHGGMSKYDITALDGTQTWASGYNTAQLTLTPVTPPYYADRYCWCEVTDAEGNTIRSNISHFVCYPQ